MANEQTPQTQTPQPLFVNETILTEETFKEIQMLLGGLKPVRMLIFCGILVLAGIFGFIVDIGTFFDIFSIMLVTIGGLGLLLFFVIRLSIPAHYKKICELNSGNMLVTLNFYDDCFIGADATSTSRYEYSKISGINEGKNMIILLLGDPKNSTKMGVYVSKAGFTCGDCESFKDFICAKTGLIIKVVSKKR